MPRKSKYIDEDLTDDETIEYFENSSDDCDEELDFNRSDRKYSKDTLDYFNIHD